MLEKAKSRAKYLVQFQVSISKATDQSFLPSWKSVFPDQRRCWIIAERTQRGIKLFRCNRITADICAWTDAGLDLRFSLSLCVALMAIVAAARGPRSSIRAPSWLGSNRGARGCTQIIPFDPSLPFHYPAFPAGTVVVPQHLNSDRGPHQESSQ